MSIATIEPTELTITTDTGHQVYWESDAELSGTLFLGTKAKGEGSIASENTHGLLLVALNVDDEGFDEVYTETQWGRDTGQDDLRRTTDLEVVERAIEVLTNLRDGIKAASR